MRRADPTALPPRVPVELGGAHAVAKGTVALRERSRFADLAVVDGDVGLVVAPRGPHVQQPAQVTPRAA